MNKINKFINAYIFISTIFLTFCFVIHMFVAQYGAFPWLNLLVFLTLFVTAIINPLFSVSILTFIVPFIANISEQIKAIYNLEVFTLNYLSIDASIGLILGLLILGFFTEKWKLHSEDIQDKKRIFVYLLLSFQILIIITVGIGISRNLYQATSPYSIKGFFYNLVYIRLSGWHDDYFPLSDLLVFTTAITLSIRLLALVRTKSQLRERVLAPLFAATVIILIYALWSKLTGIGILIAGLKGVNSFLPDIHAFGGYALAALLGGLYYITSSQVLVKLIAGAFSLLATAGVVVSGSRFSIVMLFITFIVYVFLLTKRSKKYLASFAFISLVIVTTVFLLNYSGDRGLIQDLTVVSKAESFQKVNLALSYRPELFASALLMYSKYPILGIGKGIFFRQSSIGEFSKSPYFVGENGSHAHNYFLEILTETGIVGFSLFCAIFIYQAVYLRNRDNEIVTVLILGMFLGNIYGHSLLIPNLLVLLFILLGVSSIEDTNHSILEKENTTNINHSWRYIILTIAIVIAIIATLEVKNSYGKLPFQPRFVCYKPAYYSDKHTGGLFEHKYKARGNNLKLAYTVYHPDTQSHPLTIRFNIEQEGKNIVSSKKTVNSPGQYQENLDISSLVPGSLISLQIKTSRCLTPIDLGLNLDKRRLGIQVNKVFQDKRVVQAR